MNRVLRILIGLVLLFVLVLGGFALGVYLQLIDTQEYNEAYKLYELPVIGELFVRPDGMEEAEKTETQSAALVSPEIKQTEPKESESRPRVLTREEIEKERQARLAEEKKRVAKLARVYDQMKPKAAAEVLAGLDDVLAVEILQRMDEGQAAKVLAAMDNTRSATLTELLYTGVRDRGVGSRPGATGNADAQSTAEENVEMGTQN